MGNSASRERRRQESGAPDSAYGSRQGSLQPDGGDNQAHGGRSGRGSRHDVSIFNLGGPPQDGPEVRRETKPEREARRLERERVIRAKERERSMREEHVDGGYLVTQGVYTGPEDFNRGIVRQFMIERRIAPFWRGLNDFNEEWTEHQLVAGARGLPIPAADEIPTESPPPRPSTSGAQSSTVSASSPSESGRPGPSTPSYQPSLLPVLGPSSHGHSPATSSPFKPRTKTVASLTSTNPLQSDIVQREIQLPADPYVNGLHMEAFLYKDATECPICFIYYPPYLNKTRCCDQAICSECFVQIKRPDPHVPEQHGDADPPAQPEENPAGTLISEPANCPYCQQPEFGVTYEPPPFRRGLAYANMITPSREANASSEASVDGASSLSPAGGSRRRATSVSANASNVITTDKIRPDWTTKLANARNHANRRAAAATALHTAAYLMGNQGDMGRFSGRGRFFRRQEGDNGPPIGLGPENAGLLTFSGGPSGEGPAGRRHSRMNDVEEMMILEAIRMSLAEEEERKRKEEKQAKKDAKKKEKEQKKADKAASKGIYGEGSSRSGSALSLILPGRRRGNSGSSLLARHDVSPAGKGKGVDRGTENVPSSPQSGLQFVMDGSPSTSSTPPAGQHLSASPLNQSHEAGHSGTPSTLPDRPTHLRHMSTASSQSSFIESATPSVRRGLPGSSSSFNTPNASGVSLNREREHESDIEPGSVGAEPMFNFRKLADEFERRDKEDGVDENRIEYSSSRRNSNSGAQGDDAMQRSVATLRAEPRGEGSGEARAAGDGLQVKHETPDLMVTPVTPTAGPDNEDDCKQIGH